MAIVILAGLLSSTVLNMLVLPALYLRYGELGRHASIAHDADGLSKSPSSGLAS